MIPELPTLILSTPLYASIDLGTEFEKYLRILRASNLKFDGYCPSCKNTTTYLHKVDSLVSARAQSGSFPFCIGYQGGGESASDFLFSEYYICARNTAHYVEVYFKADGLKLEKLGQTPSVADLQFGQFKKYEKILEKKYHSELMKAIGLKSHGIGIGSFVYLRRIFEKLIDEAHSIAQKDTNWNEPDYVKARMAEKVEMLKDHLPAALVENKGIYSILSLGIHELEENETLEVHDIILASIEMILDEKQYDELKKQRDEEIRKKVAGINFGKQKSSTRP